MQRGGPDTPLGPGTWALGTDPPSSVRLNQPLGLASGGAQGMAEARAQSILQQGTHLSQRGPGTSTQLLGEDNARHGAQRFLSCAVRCAAWPIQGHHTEETVPGRLPPSLTHPGLSLAPRGLPGQHVAPLTPACTLEPTCPIRPHTACPGLPPCGALRCIPTQRGSLPTTGVGEEAAGSGDGGSQKVSVGEGQESCHAPSHRPGGTTKVFSVQSHPNSTENGQ